jgi:hypothetical protein
LIDEGAARELAALNVSDQATQSLLVHVKTPRLFQPFARPDATHGPSRFDCKENRLARGGQRRGQGPPMLPMSQRMRGARAVDRAEAGCSRRAPRLSHLRLSDSQRFAARL